MFVVIAFMYRLNFVLFVFYIITIYYFFPQRFISAMGTPCSLDRIFYFINCEPQRFCVLLNHLNCGLKDFKLFIFQAILMWSNRWLCSHIHTHTLKLEKWALTIEHTCSFIILERAKNVQQKNTKITELNTVIWCR